MADSVRAVNRLNEKIRASARSETSETEDESDRRSKKRKEWTDLQAFCPQSLKRCWRAQPLFRLRWE